MPIPRVMVQNYENWGNFRTTSRGASRQSLCHSTSSEINALGRRWESTFLLASRAYNLFSRMRRRYSFDCRPKRCLRMRRRA